MPDNYFTKWFNLHSNFLNEAVPSTKWDEVIAVSEMQKAICEHKEVQHSFKKIELKIATDYGLLIDVKLTEVFRKLNRKDFSDPSGFAEAKEASESLKGYFITRNCLEHFARHDIIDHLNGYSQSSAFRRWISIAELLLLKRNYDGFFLIANLLFQLDNNYKFTIKTPPFCRDRFNFLIDLLSPENSFLKLKEYIKVRENINDFYPLPLFTRLLTHYNCLLGDKKDEPLENFSSNAPIRETALHKHALLIKISEGQNRTVGILPEHLIISYELAEKLYSTYINADQKKSFDCQPVIRPLKLYSKKLQPFFWTKKDAHEYWKDFFNIDDNAEYLYELINATLITANGEATPGVNQAFS